MALPPRLWAELFFDGTWNPVTRDLRKTSTVTFTRGLSAESSSAAAPTVCECVLDNRSFTYAPRNPESDLYGKIGRNTPMRLGYYAGSPWAEMPGTAGNSLTTPDAAGLAVTDLDLRIELALEDWSQQKLAGRYEVTGDNRSWGLMMGGTGQVSLLWSPNGTLASRIQEFSTEPLKAYNGQRLTLRVTLDVNNGAGGYEVRFYTGRTVDDEEWNLLGEPVVGAATTAVFDGTAGIELGDIADLLDDTMNGKLFAFKLLSGIGTAGTVAASMRTSDAGAGVRSFTSGGATWTVNGGAALTNKHTRISGEVPEWPPSRDISGNDSYVSVAPTGITRRMDAGNKPEDSALLRFIRADNPIECWPLTDGLTSTRGKSLVGGKDMVPVLTSGSVPPEWGVNEMTPGIEPVIALKKETRGTITGRVPNSTSAASLWSVDYFFATAAQGDCGTFSIYDRGANTDADNLVYFQIGCDQGSDDLTVFRFSQGETSSSFALISTVTSPGVFDGLMHHIRFTMDPGGSDSVWAIYIDGVQADTGTLAGIVVKAVSQVSFSWSLTTSDPIQKADTLLGYVTYWDSNGPTAAEMWQAATGFPGEAAGARIERLAAEGGYTATVAGESVHQELVGVQTRQKLLALMNEAARTNFGYLLDARDRAEVIHHGHSTLWNQPPAVTLDFSAGLISSPFAPRDDDKLTENDVSVRRRFGQVPARQVLESGALSVLEPPDGVGRYDNEYTYSLYTDGQAAGTAAMLVHLGTYDGVRYSRITLDLANPRVAQMIDPILRLDVGDKVRLTRLPKDHGPDDVDVLVVGYTEEAGPDRWRLVLNCVPAEPWTAFTLDSDTYSRLDTAGCELTSGITATATSVAVTTTALRRWIDSATYPTHFPFDIRVGGEVMRVTACAGTTLSQTFTVTRSVNGVRKAHDAGEGVALAHPVYLSL
ncbi:hypothetical protein [Streptomyces capitiformicae]|uniref:Uncharacterized protein n=1 Tax=Streptomyces capitiformicae TaxID=2014920 RepID=A0A919GFS7_9ACTN|nr:hypothetical protein [Streptomyces capitiformicae]GHH83873.1 hypothetical protein GCM10017771_11590 [Streptomyces capitiformicae]